MISTKKIQMVDLKGQYEKIKTEVDAGIQEVLNTTAFILRFKNGDLILICRLFYKVKNSEKHPNYNF